MSDCDLETTRLYDYPPQVVFDAWADPDKLAQWWGPRGFTNTFEIFEFRPGGIWEFVMHGPDGKNYKNKSIFSEIVPPERIVFDHVSGHSFRLTAIFAGRGEQTELTFRMSFDSPEECARVAEFAIEANEQNLDRLGEVLARTA